MMKRLTLMLVGALTLLGACTSKVAVEEQFRSTVVNEDGTVTFRYLNPNAKSVLVDVQFAVRNEMTLDSLTGIWSVTVGPAQPDIYPYCFVVDGVSIMDPENMQYFPNEGFKNSLLDIPGTAPLPHDITNVPHGNVEYIRYYSNAIGDYNNALVYTPPSYDESERKAYPVFYLISGTTDTEEVYYKVGRVNYILDNLIAQGKAKDMIIVMPYGNPGKLVNAPVSMTAGGFKDYFSDDLINDLMPYIESHYRTINNAANRAIGGFSRGGNQGLMNGLMNLDKFSYLCSYSSFTSPDLPGVYDNADDTNSRINLLWTGVGTDDFLYGTARDYTEFLDNKGIRCVKFYTDDKFGHTWMNARCFLAETLPLLFDPEASAVAMAAATPTKPKSGNEPEFTPGVMARLFPKPIVSPEVSADSVTFRIKAENASEVYLAGDFSTGPIAMKADTTGVWSVSLPLPAADVYCYNFIVDGTQVADNQNMYPAPARGFIRSVLDLTPHTDVMLNDCSAVQYRVDNLPDGTQRMYAVVAPRTGDTSKMRKIALIADGPNTWEGWHKIAKVNQVLDTMVSAGNADPCVLVLSDGPVDGASVTINASDYENWSQARKALIESLKK